MWLRALLRTWFPRRQNSIQTRKKIGARKSAKPLLEILEERLAPAVAATISYVSSTNELDIVVNKSETIDVTSPASNEIQIQVTGNSDTINLGSNTSPTYFSGGGSQTVTITNVGNGLTVNAFNVNLANTQSNADALTFGVDSSCAIQEVNIGSGTVAGTPQTNDTYDNVTLGSVTIGDTLNVSAASIAATSLGGAANVTAPTVVLAAGGTGGSIGPIATDIGELTASTYDGGITIANSGPGPLQVDSIVADQGGQGPTVNTNSNYGTTGVVYNSNPSGTPSYIAGSSDVTIDNAGAVVLNSISATGSVTVEGEYIVEGDGSSQAIDAGTLDLEATGAANYQGQVTFADSAGGDTLTLPSGGPTWTAFGFSNGTAMAGDPIVISGASQTNNDATFTIASVSGDTLTLQQSFALTPETESVVSVSDGGIGMAAPPNSASTTPTAIDVAETNGFSATTTNGNIFLTTGSSVNSTAVDVDAGGTGNVSIASSSSSLAIQNITANGSTAGGSAIIGGAVSVTASQGTLVDSGSPGTITAQIASLSIAQSLGSAASPFVTSVASGLTVDATATSSSAASVYVENTTNLSSVGVTTDDGAVAIYQNNSLASPLLSFKNNHLAETGSALVTFDNTDTTGGLADNVIVNGTINALGISAGGQIMANNGATLIENTVLPMLTLSAGNGVGNPGNIIDTEVTQLIATSKSGGVYVSNTPISGSGAAVSFTAANGAIASVTGATGTGYPVNSTFDLLVTGGGGTGGVVQVTTDASGNIAGFAASPVAGGSGYTSTSGASTSNVLLLSAAAANGSIDVTNAGNIYLNDETSSHGTSTAAISSGTSATVTLDATGNIYNPSGVKAGIPTVSTGTLALTANGVGSASNPLQTAATGLTLASAVPAGLFLSNNASLTVTPTVASGIIGGDISIAAHGDLKLDGSLSGNNVTLTAQGGALTSTAATTITAAPADVLTLTAQQIGDSSAYSPDGAAANEVLQTNATVINALANFGGIYISDSSTAVLTLTAGANGPEPTPGVATSNIEIYSAGSVVIAPQTTALTSLSGSQAVGVFNSAGSATLVAGETLSYDGTTTTPSAVVNPTITSNTTLTNANSGMYFDVEAGTLSIDGVAVPTSTAATSTTPGELYGPLVVQTNTPAIPVSGSQAVVAPLELTAIDLASGGTFTASSIIIDDLNVDTLNGQPTGLGQPTGQPGVLTIANSLTLDATDGSVVFLNPNDTIVVTGVGNTITVIAGTTTAANGTVSSANSAATANDVTVLGNLQTSGGNISISAVGNVSIGKINAGSGHVYLTSLTGSILSNDGTALAITGATILRSAPQLGSGAQSASLIQLNATQAIAAATQAVAAYDAAVAQAGADYAAYIGLQAQYNYLTTQVNADGAKLGTDQGQLQTDTQTAEAQQVTTDALNYTVLALELVGATLELAGDIPQVAGFIAEEIPIIGPALGGTADAVGKSLEIIGAISETIGDAIAIAAYAEDDINSDDDTTEDNDQALVDADTAQQTADTNSQQAVLLAQNSVYQAFQNEEKVVKADAVIVTAAQIASAQATAAVIGAASPLPLTVAGPVNITDQGAGANGGSITVNTPITVAAPGGAQVSFTTSNGVVTVQNPNPVNGVITSVNPTPANGGSNYPADSTFDLAVTGGGGTGGVVQATTNASGAIVSFAATPLAGGSGYSTGTALTGPYAVVATTGSGAQTSFTAAGGVITSVSSTPAAGGTGYPDSSTFDLAVTGGGGTGGVVQATTNASGVVTSFTLLAGGSGYTTTGATTPPGIGSGAQVAFTAVGGVITSVSSTPVAGGAGYPVSTTLEFTVAGGSGGVVQAVTNASGVVTSFSLLAGGIGYNSTAATGLPGVTIYANSPVTVSANITAPGAINLTADSVLIAAGTTLSAGSTITITGDTNDAGGANVTVNGTLQAQSALITTDAGSPGNDTFNITPFATTPITVTGVGAGNTLNFNALGLAVTISETPSGDTITAAGMQPVTVSNIAYINITNGKGVKFARFSQGASAAFTYNSVPLSVTGLWVNQDGSFIVNGTKNTAQSSPSLATVNGISNAGNEAVDLTINTLTTGEQVGLVTRYSGSGLASMYYGSIVATSANTYTANISLYVKGAPTSLFSQKYTGTVPSGDTLEFDVVGDFLQLFLNSSLVAYANDTTFATGGVGMMTSGGQVVVSNFNAAPITLPAPNNTLSDSFSTQGSSVITGIANGQLDTNWVNQVGEFATAGSGTATASSMTALATLSAVSNANEALELTINSLTSGEQIGLVARYSGPGVGSMYYGSITATSANSYTANINLYVNGVATSLFSQSYTGTPSGETLEFDVVSDSLQLFLNGSLVAFANDTTLATGGAGMLAKGGPVVVSNFSAAPIAQQTGANNAYIDTFNAQGQDAITSTPDGQLSDYWVNQYGDFTTAGTGTARALTAKALATVAGTSTAANEAVSLTISALPIGAQVGLVARYSAPAAGSNLNSGSGLANLYFCSIVATSANTYTAYIYLNVNGVPTTLFSQSYTGTVTGKTLEFDVVGTSLQVYLNGSIVAYANDSTLTTGPVGMLASSGAVVSNFKAAPIIQQTSSINAYSDNFTTANGGRLDNYWVNQAGAFTTSGTGTASSVNALSLTTVAGITSANEAASFTINTLPNGAQVGLVARYTGSGLANMYLGSITANSANSYTATIYLYVKGVRTTLFTQSYAGTTAGKLLEFDVVGTSLQLFLNGSLVADANDLTLTGGTVGMAALSGVPVVSNFNAAPITLQPAAINTYTDTFNMQGASQITGINNGQLDNYWSNQSGYFTTTGAGTAKAATTMALATVNGTTTAANEAASLVINTIAAGQQVGLAARYSSGTGLGNMYYGAVTFNSATSYTANIYLYVNGVRTALFTQTYTGPVAGVVTGKTLEFDVVGSTLQLFLNGSLIGAANNSTLAAGSVGMLASNTVVVSNFNAAPITQQTAGTTYSDSFSTQGQDAITSANDGQLDNFWVNQTGDFTTSGTGTATAATPTALATVNGVNTQLTALNPFTDTFTTQGAVTNDDVHLTINSLPTGAQVGLVSRFTAGAGGANMYYGSITANTANSYTATIYVNVNGAPTALYSKAYTGSVSTAVDGQTLEFIVTGASLQLKLGGTLVASATSSTYITGGVGMLTSGTPVVVSAFNAAASNGPSDGQLDNYWVNQSGNFTTTGSGTAKAATPTALATVNGVSAANEAVGLTVNSLTAGEQVGLVARYNGSGLANMYYGSVVATSAGTYTANIYLYAKGAPTTLFTQSYTGAVLSGEKLEFDVVGDSLQLFLNGSLVAYASDTTYAAGGVGMMTSGGAVVVSNFNAAPITPPPAANNTYSDNFSTQGQTVLTAANNGQLDGHWLSQTGAFQVNTTNLTATALASPSLAAVNGISNANEAVSLTVNTLETGEQVGLAARYNGSGLANLYYGSIAATSAGTYTASISMYVGGISTPLFSQTYSGSATTAVEGKTLEFDVVGASLQLFLNGSIVAYANNTALTTGGVGMLATGGAVVVSNFNAVPITPLSATYPFLTVAAGASPITGLSNSQLNSYWSIQSGDYVDNAGTLTGQSSGVNLATANGVSQATADVSTNITLTAGQYAGLVAYYSGTGVQNMYLGEIVAGSGTYTANIYLIQNGAWTLLSSSGPISGSVTGAALEFVVSGGSLTLNLNSTSVATAADLTLSSGSVGILSSGGATISGFNAA